MKPTILEYLSRFSSFTKQSELLCTQGLTYILRTYPAARRAFAHTIEKKVDFICGDSLHWLAEPAQTDGGRPDLEARLNDGTPIIKIEAKLRAELGPLQLKSYINDLDHKSHGKSLLLVLVPDWRVNEVCEIVAKSFGFEVSRLFSMPSLIEGEPITAYVISWNELFDDLKTSEEIETRYQHELEQLRAMYRELSGDYITPLANKDILDSWKKYESEYISLIDQLTRRLNYRDRVLPIQKETIMQNSEFEANSTHTLRYVCPFSRFTDTCFSIGVRDPFAGYITPVWMRFHGKTPYFSEVQSRVKLSSLDWLESDGHLWLPLDVPQESSIEKTITPMMEKVRSIIEIVEPDQTSTEQL